MTTKIKRVVAVLNSMDLASTILEKSLSFATNYSGVVEIIYIHEKPLFDLPDFFMSEDKRGGDLIDKERVKDSIKALLRELGHEEEIAIFVYIDDTEDRVANLIKDDKDCIIITSYHEKITNRVIKKVSNPVLVLKNKKDTYSSIAIAINSNSDALKCISLAKELFKSSQIFLMFDYRFVVDPSMELDLQNVTEIENIQRERFEDIKSKSGLDGEFFIDGSFLADNLIQHINEKDFDLVMDCLNDGNLLTDHISNNIFFKGESMSEQKIKLKKISESLSNSKALSSEEKTEALTKVEEWYEEDRGMELLAEQLASISSKITPILREIGL